VNQGSEGLHDEDQSTRPPINNLGTKILAWLESEPFISAGSLSEILEVGIRDSVGPVAQFTSDETASREMNPTSINWSFESNESWRML
jgi:hypothetical protein